MTTIAELEDFKMSDAVEFHTRLNPKLWTDNKLDSTVKDQLLLIAQDFVSSLGISDLDVVDVTVSGSNAAYSYTPHSDLDLHVLVDMSNLNNDEIYRELFTAKKTLYNDSHDITVRGIPVELYVQDVNEPVKSLGEYSVIHDKWIRIPKKQRANFDEVATKAKFDNLAELVELALTSKDIERVEKTISTIKRYRKAGLAKGGEFSPENLSFKAIRKQGGIQDLYDLRAKLQSERLSIEESAGAIADTIKSELGLKQFIVTERGNDITVDSIIVGKENQGKGLGSSAMKRLIDYADQTGKRIILTPGLQDKTHGTTSRSRLVKFYKSLGFKENKGRSIDFAIGAGKMYRDPKLKETMLDKPTLSVAELADKHGVSRMQIAKQLDKGIKVELEHTSDPDVAREIALDHLAEDPEYYDKLASLQLESKTVLRSIYEHEGQFYHSDFLLEQQLYEDFLGSAKQFLGAKFNNTMANIKGQVNDTINAGIIIKDVASNQQLMDNVTAQIRRWTSQQIKTISASIQQIGQQLNTPQLADKLVKAWQFISAKAMEFSRSPGWKGFLGSLGIYGFVKFIGEMVKNVSTLKATILNGALDALLGKAKELGASIAGNITMPGFLSIFDKLSTVKQYFFDVLNQVKAKFGSVNVAGTPQFSRGVQLENNPHGRLDEIGFADELSNLSMPDIDIIENSEIAGNIGQKPVRVYRRGTSTLYFFATDTDILALVLLDGTYLKAIKNFTNEKGMIYSLLNYIVNLESQRIDISPDEQFTSEGFKWLLRLAQSSHGLRLTTTDGGAIDADTLAKEWNIARQTKKTGPTGLVISELSLNWKNRLIENENSLMPYRIFESSNYVLPSIRMIDQIVDGGSLDGYVVDTDKEQLSNYLESQGANPEIAKKLAKRYNRIGIIKNMWVDEEERNQGLGTDLVSNAIDDAYLNGAEAVLLVSDEGESNEFNLTKWYQGFGFKKIGMAGSDPVMLLHKQPVNEDSYTDRIRTYKNPSPKALYNLTSRSAYKRMRGMYHDGDTYWWDANDAIHKEGADSLGIPYDYLNRLESAIDSISGNYRVGGDDGVPEQIIQRYDIENEYVDEQVCEASGYIPSAKEKNDPRFKTALTKDVRPDTIKKNAKAFGFKTSRAGIPPRARADGKIAESLMNEWKAFLAEDEQQGELFPDYDKEHKEKRLDNWLQSTHAWDGHKPRVFYHATTKDFDTFNTHGTGFASALGMAFEVERHGSFFAVDPKFAEEFIEDPNRPGQYKEGGRVIPVYLSIQNPIDLRDDNLSYMLRDDETVEGFKANDIDLWSIYRHYDQFDRWELFDGPEGGEFVNNLQKLGFDGAIIVERVNGDAQNGEVWVAFNPNQVKAIHNRGSFSPNDPRLMRESSALEYLGNCTEDDVVDDIFGNVSEFARMVEEHGDEFTLGNLVVKYDDDQDIHYFYKDNG